MAEEKPTPEGQAGTQVAEPEVVEMTEQELAHRIDTDNDFANAYLKGDVHVEAPKAPEPDAPAPEAKPSESAPAAKTPEPDGKKETITPTDDGKFVVDFEDGSKLQYKSKPEALKAIREKENMIRRQKSMISESRLREQQLADRIKQLENSKPPVVAPAAPEAKKPDEKLAAKAEEELDPFDPDYQKNLAAKIKAQEETIKRLEGKFEETQKQHEADKEEQKRRDEEKAERDKRNELLKSHYSEANQFVSRHPEFKLDKPVDVIDQEYKHFLEELGSLAGTDGTMRQNVVMMDLFQDETSEQGKKLRAEAEKIGLKPPDNLNIYFSVLHVTEQRKRLNKFDEVTGKMVPFTMEETYRYLQMQNGSQAPEPPTPPTPPPASQPAASTAR